MGRRKGPAAMLGSLFGKAAAILSASAPATRRANARPLGLALILSTALVSAVASLAGSPAHAQTLADRIQPKQTGEPDRLLVQAKELVYDNKTNRVGATGNVQLY